MSKNQLVAISNEEILQVMQDVVYPGANMLSVKMALSYCTAAGLDPLQKPVHIVPMWDSKNKKYRDVIMPGIGLYRTQAARNGCAGIAEPEFGPDVTETIGSQTITYPKWCKVSVKRMLASGEIVEFTAKEFWKENYAPLGGAERKSEPNFMWSKRPYGQLAKCAEAQALRKAFPEVGSQPTADEMEGKQITEFINADTGEIIESPPTSSRPELIQWPDESFNAQMIRWEKAVSSGLKTATEILTLAKSRGLLTHMQEARILSLKVTPAESLIEESTPESDDQPPF